MTIIVKGIEKALFEQIATGFSKIPFNQVLGLSLSSISPEHVVMAFTMRDELIGNFMHAILHGGVIASVLDMAGGMAVMTSIIHTNAQLPIPELALLIGKCSTVDLQVSFLRPGKGEQFTANAWLLKAGRRIFFTRMELTNEANRLIATATGTYTLR